MERAHTSRPRIAVVAAIFFALGAVAVLREAGLFEPSPWRAAAASASSRCESRGMSSKQIRCVGIRLRTVNTYHESLARKLGASSAAVITRFLMTTELTASIEPTALR